MKNHSVRLLIVCVLFFTACSKNSEFVEIPPPDALDLLTRISNSWELYMYNISTDKEKYYFTGEEVKEHSLRTVTFRKDGNYTSASASWSGTYRFLNDSTQIVLTPAAPYLVACELSIDNISLHRMQFSSPWVQVNPEKPGASNYERFIAYESLKFLSLRGKDISSLKSVKIEFRYFAR